MAFGQTIYCSITLNRPSNALAAAPSSVRDTAGSSLLDAD